MMAPRRASLQTTTASKVDKVKHDTLRNNLVLDLAMKRVQRIDESSQRNVRLSKGYYNIEVRML